MPYINNNYIGLNHIASLISILVTAFGDLDKVVTKQRKLRKLQQANWDFSKYYTEFVYYATETTWNEVAKRLQLEEGLCYELKNDLITRNRPELVTDFISLL